MIMQQLNEKTKLTLYVDLDGVLCDLVRQGKELFGFEPRGHLRERNKAKEKQFWKAVNDHYSSGEEFWRSMHPMTDAMELWEFIKPHHPTVLTSRGKISQAEDEKRDWVVRNLGDDVPVIVVSSGKLKANYASETAVLIDDTEHVIDAFVHAGGIGILHTSAKDTIENLKHLFNKKER